MRKITYRMTYRAVVSWLVLLLGCLIPSDPVAAASREEREAAALRATKETATSLFAKARQQGSVRVIVALRFDFVPEGALQSRAARSQRQRIRGLQDSVVQRLAARQPRKVTRFRSIPALALEVDAGSLEALLDDPRVVQVMEDLVMVPSLDGTIPLIGASEVHDLGFTGAGQAVAILDTGVEAGHSFFGGRVVAEACFSSGPEGLCPNGQDVQIGPGAAAPCGDCRHGTHVAGIAAGRGSGMVGVVPDAGVIAVQVFSRGSSDADCPPDSPIDCRPRPQGGGSLGAWTEDLLLGLEHVLELADSYDVAAVNMSLGTELGFSSPCIHLMMDDLVANLRSRKIAVIAASGNESLTDQIAWPACLPGIVSVGATKDSDRVRSRSNSALFLDLLAPGEDVRSSLLNGDFGDLSGTSMAAPHVAGAWAVMRQAAPTWDVWDILNVLKQTGRPILDSRNGLTFPRLDLAAAIDATVCRPPASGDWSIERDCSLESSAAASGDIFISGGATLTIAAGVTLMVDLSRYQLTVARGSRLLVKAGGALSASGL